MKRNKSFEGNEPILYLVSTPIGNLEEFNPRAIHVLNEMDVVAAEDTRNSKFLLDRFNIKREMFSLREHNENEASMHIIKLLNQGKKVAYVSDAGYPGISDPGQLLVKNVLNEGMKVSVINGSCAFINALVASGLSTKHFYFHGFLPAKESEAKEELEALKDKNETLIFYESPHRIIKSMCTMYDVLGDREATIGRELTKLNEEFIRGKLSELIKIDESTLKGEMVVVIEGKEKEEIDDKELIEKINYLKEKGLSNKDAISTISDFYKINKNYLKKLIEY